MAVITAGLYGIMALANAWTPRLGLDLRGGTTITLTARTTSGEAVASDKLAEARGIIQQRVDSLGVGEAVVTTQGDQHIVISVPNVQRDELLNLVGQTAKLGFRAVYTVAAVQQPTATASPSAGGTATPGATVTGLPQKPSTPTPSPAPTVTGLPASPGASADATASGSPTSSDITGLLSWAPTAEVLNDFESFKCDDKRTESADQPLIACDREGTAKYLLGPTLISGEHVTNAVAGMPQGQVAYVVSLSFDSTGADAFYKATSYLSGQQQPRNMFAIVLDAKVVSAPVPNGPIAGGNAEISGNFSLDTATQLARVLKYGALPLAFDVSQVENVSATLGGEQLTGGIIAGIIGLILVIAYGFVYYRALGFVVVGSLAAAAVMTYATMTLLGESVGFALNLPGIAGVIVAIGLTADSFIIYFERIRDEIREGRSLRTSIETGWTRARSTIVIADMVSLLSAVVLFFLAVGGVKGFAFTLGLTTLIDLAVVFWFTKPVMSLLGRTKFFGEGHKWSGLDPEHMGVSREALLGRRTRTIRTTAKEA